MEMNWSFNLVMASYINVILFSFSSSTPVASVALEFAQMFRLYLRLTMLVIVVFASLTEVSQLLCCLCRSGSFSYSFSNN